MNPTEQDIVRTNYWMRVAGLAAIGLLGLFLFAATLYTFKSMHFVGSGVSATNTITVSGNAEVAAVADMATFSVSVQERAKTVAPAQEAATAKTNAIIAYLREQGVEDKDIKTQDYSVYPQYEWTKASCRAGEYCPPEGRQTLTGYEVSQTITVKVRDTEKAGELLSGVGTRGATSVSGLSFTIDDEDALKVEARGEAIAEARAKASALAKQLNVRIVRVVGFSEDGYYPPMPYAARGGAMNASFDMVAQEAKASPELPVGENKIISNVTITYEIR